MNKFSVLASAVVLTLAGSTTVFAAPSGPAGFDNVPGGPQGFSAPATPNSVRDVINQAYDDQRVTLNGKLTDYLGHDRYVFADSTGRIEVELDDDRDWSFIRKDQPITIFGKVDRDRHSISIDVKDARPAQ